MDKEHSDDPVGCLKWCKNSYKNVYSNKTSFCEREYIKTYKDVSIPCLLVILIPTLIGGLILGPLIMTRKEPSETNIINAHAFSIDSCDVTHCMLFYVNAFKNSTVQRTITATSPDPSFIIQDNSIDYYLDSAECAAFEVNNVKNDLSTSTCNIWYSYSVENSIYTRMKVTIMDNYDPVSEIQYAIDSPANEKYDNPVSKSKITIGIVMIFMSLILSAIVFIILFLFHSICYLSCYINGYIRSMAHQKIKNTDVYTDWNPKYNVINNYSKPIKLPILNKDLKYNESIV